MYVSYNVIFGLCSWKSQFLLSCPSTKLFVELCGFLLSFRQGSIDDHSSLPNSIHRTPSIIYSLPLVNINTTVKAAQVCRSIFRHVQNIQFDRRASSLVRAPSASFYTVASLHCSHLRIHFRYVLLFFINPSLQSYLHVCFTLGSNHTSSSSLPK